MPEHIPVDTATQERIMTVEDRVAELERTNAVEHRDILSELKLIMNEIKHDRKDVRDSLARIETQTTQTNGRVTTLDRLKWIITGIVVVSVPIIVILINTVMNNTGIIRQLEQIHKDELVQSPKSIPIK